MHQRLARRSTLPCATILSYPCVRVCVCVCVCLCVCVHVCLCVSYIRGLPSSTPLSNRLGAASGCFFEGSKGKQLFRRGWLQSVATEDAARKFVQGAPAPSRSRPWSRSRCRTPPGGRSKVRKLWLFVRYLTVFYRLMCDALCDWLIGYVGGAQVVVLLVIWFLYWLMSLLCVTD